MLDSQPVVTPEQISFWKWIADYYICSPGEVMTAAMPAGMKLASESIITINPDDDGNATLSEREQRVKDMLATDGKMSVSVLESKTGCKNIMSTVRSLYDKGVVRVNEVVASKYKARQETRVEPVSYTHLDVYKRQPLQYHKIDDIQSRHRSDNSLRRLYHPAQQ